MDRDVFTEKMKNAGKPDMEATKLLLKHSVDTNQPDGNPRGHRNLIIVMEELAELGKEIAKELRGKGDFTAILEELADVQLGIWYVQEVVGISDDQLQKALHVKLERLSDVLHTQGRHL